MLPPVFAADGFDDPSMGWARYAQSFTHFNLNSGLFYLRASSRTIELMSQIDAFLQKNKYWDQTAFNEFIFRPSHDDYKAPQVSVRVMDIYKFMNSKVGFVPWLGRLRDVQVGFAGLIRAIIPGHAGHVQVREEAAPEPPEAGRCRHVPLK